MERKTIQLELPDNFSVQQLIEWAGSFSPALILNSNSSAQNFSDPYSQSEIIGAIGCLDELICDTDCLRQLESYIQKPDWYFGYFTYDLKNELENLHSSHPDMIQFPALHFFRPRYLARLNGNSMEVSFIEEIDSSEEVEALFRSIQNFSTKKKRTKSPQIKERVSKDEYLRKTELVRQHIQRGDIYEMNYCVEFYAEQTDVSPSEVYVKLNEISPMPFSAYFKNDSHVLACASPERFLARRGQKIISQPIKGTAKRGKNDIEDKEIILELRNNTKEQSENVMIVDLVRNDLSRTAQKGSVKVEELFSVYTFKQLHQMISTVVSEIKPDLTNLDVIRSSFPMGSMTGAPKIRAMQLIEEFESTKRGLYSGSIGYIDPQGNFDFNVVIRSIQFNSEKKLLNFMVGSAITIASVPEKEYEECLLKAEGMMKAIRLSGLE